MQTKRRFDDNRCTSPLIGAFAAIASFPCLGYNSKVLTAPAQLRQDISKTAIDGTLEVLTGALNHHHRLRKVRLQQECSDDTWPSGVNEEPTQ